MDIHEDSYTWMTDDIRLKLAALKGRHARKKRTSVIKLAFATAQQRPLKKIFSDEDVCSEMIWYTKWKTDPLIAAAFEACCERSLAWIDEETAAIEDHYRQARRRSLAQYSAMAPAALAAVMGSATEKGEARIKAADTLIRHADPAVAGQVKATGGLSIGVEVTDIDAAIERELQRLVADAGAEIADVDGGNVEGNGPTAGD